MICPDHERRAALSDGEFWEEVLDVSLAFEGPMIEPGDDEIVYLEEQRCAECGTTGPCAYDAEGRPLIHVIGEQE